MKVDIQHIAEDFLDNHGISLYIKREDTIHPTISGNKWHKLKNNIRATKEQNKDTILTFGGAYSNHIYATSAACYEAGLKSIGIIRGEDTYPLNDTLEFAKSHGMRLHYVSRTEYRQKTFPEFIEQLNNIFGEFYLIPEGGSNCQAVKGCSEILDNTTGDFDILCVPVGTGGTIAGLIASGMHKGKILGFSALKGDFLADEVSSLLSKCKYGNTGNWEVVTKYHFGGYAKISSGLVSFIQDFYKLHRIILDPIYTGKMMYGIYDLIKKQEIPKGSRILAIHTGGLQGIAGIEKRYGVELPKNQ